MALDRYEAVAEGFYERVLLEVEVGLNRMKRRTWVYLSTDRTYGRPSSQYQRIVLEGGREIGLPRVSWEFWNPGRRAPPVIKLKPFDYANRGLGLLCRYRRHFH